MRTICTGTDCLMTQHVVSKETKISIELKCLSKEKNIGQANVSTSYKKKKKKKKCRYALLECQSVYLSGLSLVCGHM